MGYFGIFWITFEEGKNLSWPLDASVPNKQPDKVLESTRSQTKVLALSGL